MKFNPFGNKGIIIRFPCTFCDNPRITSEEVSLPSPNFKAGNPSVSYNCNIDIAMCDRCSEEYKLLVYVGINDGYVEVINIADEDLRIDEVADPIEAEYYQQQLEAITDKKQLFINYQSAIKNLRRLNALNPGDHELNSILKAQIYTGAVATMETFLSDTFINLTLEEDNYFKSFIRSYPDFKQMKFELKDVFEQYENIKATAKKVMVDIIYHNLPKVREMYQSTFSIEFPSIKKVTTCVLVRHDLVHRNGKTKDGQPVYLSASVVEDAIVVIDEFIYKIATELGIKPHVQEYDNFSDLFDDLPF